MEAWSAAQAEKMCKDRTAGKSFIDGKERKGLSGGVDLGVH